ncbi:MAG: caspase family protein [Coleofasciculaceae cyanobacterium]
MSQIKRRQFLQFASSTLATLGLSQLDIQTAANSFGRAIAQSTPRKLALLIGINTYPKSPLYGCVTDVNLQQQLLIHRFGFNPKDILMITDEQATRQGILDAFEEHLIKQAKPGDVVVYHFSGHGSQVRDTDCDMSDCLNSTFVPVDSRLSNADRVPDIMGHTLFLLMDALKTENVTVVLDSCHSGGGTRGNLRIRSRNSPTPPQITNTEQAYQQKWLSMLNLSADAFKQRRRAGVAKGVVIASAKRNQLAADSPFQDFFAGAFTYLMTQYLWQQTGNESFARVMPNIARSTTRLSFTKQEPLIEVKPGSDHIRSPIYFINETTPPAEAVITKVEGNQAQLWLGGLPPNSLAAFNSGAILSVVDSSNREQGRVELISREGLIGQAKLLDAAKSGAFLQERVRGIPSNLSLKIGLDPSLGNQINQAKQALTAIPRIEALPLQQEEVQYILGRMTPAYQQQLQATITPPEVDSFGLFSPALELIPNSFGTKTETITEAITRLRSKLQSLLAARIVKTALNTNSSRLNIVASMRPEGTEEVIASAFTVRGSAKNTAQNAATPAVPLSSQKLPLGTPVQIQIVNNETNPLYLSVLVIDPTGEISVVFPNQWAAAAAVTLVAAGQTLLIPDPNKDRFRLVTQEPKGVAEVLILASRSPLRKALQTIRAIAAARDNNRSGPVTLEASVGQNQPTEVIDNLLEDFNTGTRSASATSASSTKVQNLDTTQLAALSISFEVI